MQLGIVMIIQCKGSIILARSEVYPLYTAPRAVSIFLFFMMWCYITIIQIITSSDFEHREAHYVKLVVDIWKLLLHNTEKLWIFNITGKFQIFYGWLYTANSHALTPKGICETVSSFLMRILRLCVRQNTCVENTIYACECECACVCMCDCVTTSLIHCLWNNILF